MMMAYRSSVHQATGFSPYRLMFGEECTMLMDVGLPQRDTDSPGTNSKPACSIRRFGGGIRPSTLPCRPGGAATEMPV